ncbi:hypothetical protein RSAG8_06061, partial [Rhizoctonia solani AG-8 WAC10335]
MTFQIHRNRRGGGFSHGGTGTLTLPQENIGEAFIQRYTGAAQLIVNGRQIHVARSTKELRQDVVERLRRTTYRDPQSEAEKGLVERAQQLSVNVPLSKIEQGWIERNSDSAFSSEYSMNPDDKIQEISLQFDDTNRNIILTLSTDPNLLPEADAYHIKFRYADIEDIIFDNHTDINKLLFQLRTPVSYEATDSALAILSRMNFFETTLERRPSRCRLACLPFDQHVDLAKYISKNILVHLSKPAAKDFEKLAKLAGVTRLWKKRILSKSSTFRCEKLNVLTGWIEKHKWEVAFQLQKILSNALLDPEEYVSITPTIDRLVATSRTEHVITVLLDFITRLEVLHRIKGRGEDNEEASVHECLQ